MNAAPRVIIATRLSLVRPPSVSSHHPPQRRPQLTTPAWNGAAAPASPPPVAPVVNQSEFIEFSFGNFDLISCVRWNRRDLFHILIWEKGLIKNFRKGEGPSDNFKKVDWMHLRFATSFK